MESAETCKTLGGLNTFGVVFDELYYQRNAYYDRLIVSGLILAVLFVTLWYLIN